MGLGDFVKKFVNPIAGPVLGLAGDVIGGVLGANQSKKDMENQRDFAQYGIRWKVADAKAAGLHPLAALGASTPAYSPVGSNIPDLSKFGQNIQRAVMAKATDAERELAKLEIERQHLINDGLLMDNLSKHRSLNEIPPAMPNTDWTGVIPGQGDAKVTMLPKQQTVADDYGVEAGAMPLEQKAQLQDGSVLYMPSKEGSEPMESSPPTAAEYTGYKIGQGFENWKSWYKNNPSPTMLKQWKDLMRNNPPKKGYVWRMKNGRWFQIKASKKTAYSLFAPQWINSRRNYRKTKKRKSRVQGDWRGWTE